jgi:hypothetical protein
MEWPKCPTCSAWIITAGIWPRGIGGRRAHPCEPMSPDYERHVHVCENNHETELVPIVPGSPWDRVLSKAHDPAS